MFGRIATRLGYPLLVAGLIWPISPARFAAAQGEECADLEVTFARGSGSTPDSPEITRLTESLRSLAPKGFSIRTVDLGTESSDVYDPGAVPLDNREQFDQLVQEPLDWAGWTAQRFDPLVEDGSSVMASQLTERIADCPKSKFVVAGHALGAVTARTALSRLDSPDRERVVFTALFGDPGLSLPEGTGDFPPACRGQELSTWRRGSVPCSTDAGLFGPSDPYVPQENASSTGSWCDRNDPVCTGNIEAFENSAHGLYAEPGGAIDNAAAEILGAAQSGDDEQQTPSSVSDKAHKGSTEVAIIIDTTASMTPQIEAARATAEAIGETVTGDLAGRVAVIDLRDSEDSDWAVEIRTPLTDDVSEFRSGLNQLVADQGGGSQASLAAITTAIDELDWRTDSSRSFVIISDTTYRDPDLETDFTTSDVVDQLDDFGAASVYPIVPLDASAEYEALAAVNGGAVIIDAGDTRAALTEAFNQIQGRPTALLSVNDVVAKPGDDVQFDGTLSYAASGKIISYDWDFDGDGKADEQTEEATVSHAYEGEFAGTATLTVTTDAGGKSTVGSQVKIDPDGLISENPDKAEDFRLTPGVPSRGGRPVLNWTEAEKGGPADFYALTNQKGVIVDVVPATSTAIQLTRSPMRETADLHVVATNRYDRPVSDQYSLTRQRYWDALRLPGTMNPLVSIIPILVATALAGLTTILFRKRLHL